MAQSRPPLGTDYRYFDSSAREWIKSNRPAWLGAQRTTTISVIWHARLRVRQHFQGARGTNPGPGLPDWLVIPNLAYTKAQATTARNGGIIQGLGEDRDVSPRGSVASEPDVPELQPEIRETPPEIPETTSEMSKATSEIPETQLELSHSQRDVSRVNQPDIPAVDHPRAPEITAPNAAPDGRQYRFWPQPPWDDEMIYTSLDLQIQRDFRRGWVYGRWYTVRQLNRNDIGVTFLYVRTNTTNNIIVRMVIKERKVSPKEWRDPQ
ncbi:hypothetical protein J1614_008897 [Plenodomus biglobosus]|nr:hypothetical protein J1614_008897 [Plenodomus biglobosus]